MSFTRIKKMIPFAALIIVAGLFASCNRGYGCPSNFKVDAQKVVKVTQPVLQVIQPK